MCLIDPVGDVYACPFVLHDEFLAGSVRDEGGFQKVWQEMTKPPNARTDRRVRSEPWPPPCVPGRLLAAKFFTGIPLDGPDPNACSVTARRRWIPSPVPP